MTTVTETAAEKTTFKASFRGVLTFSLLNMNVGLFKVAAADPGFKQVHTEDGGAITYKRFCEVCKAEVPWEDIGKGRKVGGVMYTFTDDELAELPVSGSSREIRIVQFVKLSEVDPIGFTDSYYIEPDEAGIRAYTLLRQTMKSSRRVAVARFAFKEGTRNNLAVIRPDKQLLVLQRYEWPEMIRAATFPFLDVEVTTTQSERDTAKLLVDTMTGPWVPDENRSDYGAALEVLMARKLAGDKPEPPPTTPAQKEARQDIGAVLTAAIEAETKRRGKKQEDVA